MESLSTRWLYHTVCPKTTVVLQRNNLWMFHKPEDTNIFAPAGPSEPK